MKLDHFCGEEWKVELNVTVSRLKTGLLILQIQSYNNLKVSWYSWYSWEKRASVPRLDLSNFKWSWVMIYFSFFSIFQWLKWKDLCWNVTGKIKCSLSMIPVLPSFLSTDLVSIYLALCLNWVWFGLLLNQIWFVFSPFGLVSKQHYSQIF